MTKFVVLMKQFVAALVKDPSIASVINAVLDFLAANEHLIDMVLEWFENLFSSTEGGIAEPPAALAEIAAELKAIKAVQLS